MNEMVHEEEKHDNELAVEGEKDDENEETEEQEHELGLGMVEVNYENEEHVIGEQPPLEIVNTDHDQNNDEQLAEEHVEEKTVQLEAVGNLDFIFSSVQLKLKYYHFIIPQIHPLSLLVLLRKAIIYKPSILERNQGMSG